MGRNRDQKDAYTSKAPDVDLDSWVGGLHCAVYFSIVLSRVLPSFLPKPFSSFKKYIPFTLVHRISAFPYISIIFLRSSQLTAILTLCLVKLLFSRYQFLRSLPLEHLQHSIPSLSRQALLLPVIRNLQLTSIGLKILLPKQWYSILYQGCSISSWHFQQRINYIKCLYPSDVLHSMLISEPESIHRSSRGRSYLLSRHPISSAIRSKHHTNICD